MQRCVGRDASRCLLARLPCLQRNLFTDQPGLLLAFAPVTAVYLLGSASTVHLSNLVDCVVCLGPVARSVFITDCTGCTLAIACQQVGHALTGTIGACMHTRTRGVRASVHACTCVFPLPHVRA